jgi:hypothetical protein
VKLKSIVLTRKVFFCGQNFAHNHLVITVSECIGVSLDLLCNSLKHCQALLKINVTGLNFDPNEVKKLIECFPGVKIVNSPIKYF